MIAAPEPLAGRYSFARRIRGTERTIIWVARDEKTRSVVVASVLAAGRVAGLAPGVGVVHPHAAKLLQVMESFGPSDVPGAQPTAPDASIVVAEHLEGRSLQQRLDAGPLSIENAVEWTATIADALATLHDAGAVHGAISPRAILVIRPDPCAVPALTHLLVPPSGAYCSPERVTGAGPSAADDTWALVATLYTALARRPPFQGGSRTELARAIVAAAPRPLDDGDMDLWAIVARGLSREPGERFASAAELRDALLEWTEMTGRHSMGDFATVAAMVGVTEEPPNVGDLSLVAALARPESPEALAPLDAPRLTDRPNLDPDAYSDPRELAPPASSTEADAGASSNAVGSASPVVASPSPEPPRRGNAPLFAGVAVVLAAAAATVVFLSQRRAESPAAAVPGTPVMESAASAPAESVAAPAESAPATTPPPAAASAAAATEPFDVNTCAATTLPDKTLGDAPDVRFLCSGTDLWGLTRKVNQMVLKYGAGDGLSLWAHLGRFDLAAVALLRQRCCPDAAPFTAATPKGLCDTLTASTQALASAPTSDNVDHYAADVECYVSHGVRYPAEWWDRITAKEARGYFEQFVGALGKPAR